MQDDSESLLAFIQAKVVQLNRLNQIWHTEMGSLGEHTRIANFREGHLIIECASAAWATQLRYRLPTITEQLIHYDALRDLKQIEWNIQPHFHPIHSISRSAPPPLSSSSAQLIKNAAQHIKIKSLQHALLRIARHETSTKK
ncbi:hypothetical protein BEV13_04435 [Rickettsiella grylli]|nr:hypothetical protein BEV13_04435 [Rickettsiella grylli]